MTIIPFLQQLSNGSLLGGRTGARSVQVVWRAAGLDGDGARITQSSFILLILCFLVGLRQKVYVNCSGSAELWSGHSARGGGDSDWFVFEGLVDCGGLFILFVVQRTFL